MQLSISKKSKLFFSISACSVAFAFTFPIHLGEISFDKQSKKVTVEYGVEKNRTTLVDSGPILLCVLNRIFSKKYEFFGDFENGKIIAKTDLALLSQAAALLPETEGKALGEAIRNYFKLASVETEEALVKVLHSSIRTGLKKHQTHYSTTISEAANETTKELSSKLAKLEAKIKVMLDGVTESELDANEKAVVRKLKREKLVLEETIEDSKQNPTVKKEEGSESPANYALCVKDENSRSRTHIDNKNLDELLGQVKVALDGLVPSDRSGSNKGLQNAHTPEASRP